MFRRKDNESPHPSEAGSDAPPRPLGETRPATTPPPSGAKPPEPPRRQVEMPTPPGNAPFLSSGERQPPSGASNAPAASSPAAAAEPANKRLIVGQGISLSGEITACDRLIVEGDVQVTLNETKAIEIAKTGRFTNGKAEVDEAEISGVYEGDLTVRNRLLIRATGKVRGNVRFGELEIERGGKLSGSVSMLSNETDDAGEGGSASRPAGEGASTPASSPSSSPNLISG